MPQVSLQYVQKDIPIFTTVLDGYEELNSKLLRGVHKWRQDNPEGLDDPLLSAWRSDWLTHKKTDVFDELIRIMETACSSFSQNYYQKPVNYITYNFWIAQYESGDKIDNHNHFPSDFSCVYYIDIDEDAAPLIIEDKLEIPVKEGLLVMFPSTITHSVPSTTGKRTCVSANFMKQASMNTPTHNQFAKT